MVTAEQETKHGPLRAQHAGQLRGSHVQGASLLGVHFSRFDAMFSLTIRRLSPMHLYSIYFQPLGYD